MVSTGWLARQLAAAPSPLHRALVVASADPVIAGDHLTRAFVGGLDPEKRVAFRRDFARMGWQRALAKWGVRA